MHRFISVAALACLGFDGSPSIGSGRPSVLVELFTSEGCSSCPAADALLARLHETQPLPGEVIALWSSTGRKSWWAAMSARPTARSKRRRPSRICRFA
ncbi:MAG: DUF1223 domain-containing protein [Acidobacteria bacterium]|nr:DUF1223 domain-containing protein [Acidobacteriota bacterium]